MDDAGGDGGDQNDRTEQENHEHDLELQRRIVRGAIENERITAAGGMRIDSSPPPTAYKPPKRRRGPRKPRIVGNVVSTRLDDADLAALQQAAREGRRTVADELRRRVSSTASDDGRAKAG